MPIATRHHQDTPENDADTSGQLQNTIYAGITRELVAQIYRVPRNEMEAPTRRAPHVARARQVAMYLTHITFGVTLTDVGRAFGRDRTTAAHACRLIEMARDNPGLDRTLTELEERLRWIAGTSEGAPALPPAGVPHR